MANSLTGDFDVVAQFSIPAVNRVLAAMHRAERFPHSEAIRVDDTGTRRFHPAAIAGIDRFGETIADHRLIGDLNPLPGLLASTDPVHRGLDHVVNIDLAALDLPPFSPSNIKGRAQIQLAPPTLDVADGSGTKVTVRIQMRSRYFPDKNTSPLAEFIRGELRITAPISQDTSAAANVVDIDIRSAEVSFVPSWSSRPLSPVDLASLNQLIRNVLRTSILPSNTTLDEKIKHLQFRTMQTGGDAIAVLLDLEEGAGDRNSANTLFLSSGDDFAFGAGSDFVHKSFEPTLVDLRNRPPESVTFQLNGVVHTWNITYTFKLNSAVVELRNGEILLIIKGRATTPSWTPNFNFTVTQRFSLAVTGGTAELVVGPISIDTSSWIIDRFRGRALNAMRSARDSALTEGDTLNKVRDMLSAEKNLGGLLNSLLEPPRPQPTPPERFNLAYSAADIRPSGIVLHGTLSVSHWPAARASFEEIPSAAESAVPILGISDVGHSPSYSALKSWIPGGTILRYEWSLAGESQPFSDENKFVFTKPPPEVSTSASAAPGLSIAPPAIATIPVRAFSPVCLTVHGTRLSSSGPVVAQTVKQTTCGVNSFPLFDHLLDGFNPLVALTNEGPDGMVRVAGHTVARKAEPGEPTPNLIVHFGDRSSQGRLESIVAALRESGKHDASTAIIAVLSKDDLASTRFVEGITYAAENGDGLWERRFAREITTRPATLIVTPGGEVVWRHEGEVEKGPLTEALKNSLVAGKPVVPAVRPPAVRIGQRTPNFLFQHAPGREITLRKVSGRPVTLVFWRSSSEQSIEAVRDVASRQANGSRSLVLAINDGDDPEIAKRIATENRFAATLVTDAARSISLAYGIDTWPTIISVDATGLARTIRQGAGADDTHQTRQGSKAT